MPNAPLSLLLKHPPVTHHGLCPLLDCELLGQTQLPQSLHFILAQAMADTADTHKGYQYM